MYTLYRTDQLEFAMGGGVHALDLSATIAAAAQVNEAEAEFTRSGTTLLAPVPNVRTSGSWRVTERLVLHATGGWLSAKIDDYDGGFLYGHLRAAFAVTDNIGLALGYQRTDIDITQTRSRSELNYDVILEGFTITTVVSF